ncbi:hypothetical protein H0R94_12315 [Treponema socranskii]|uniref:hypothetical protein n=1 Tax=Treponema socranskii TaxID=53419 RepID=UPI003D91FA5E
MKTFDLFINALPWLFSGIGVFIIGLLVKKEIKKNHQQKQNVSKKSIGIQAGGNINIGKEVKNGITNPESK